MPACLPVEEIKRHEFNPWIRNIPWRRHGNLFQYSCEKNHGQRGLVGYSLWGCKELDLTEGNLYIEILTPHRDGIMRWGIWEVIRS